VLQSALFVLMPIAAVVGPSWPASAETTLRVAGVVLVVSGLTLVVLAFRRLGRSLTPFPRPLARGRLVEDGPYRYVRHPVYSGGLLFFTGIALAYSPLVFVPTAAIAVTWGLKVQVEERFLRASYPGYATYAARTRYRLLPFIY
jgi:protein-S-isoprenylcysteine O-methyltransferase Ste14